MKYTQDIGGHMNYIQNTGGMLTGSEIIRAHARDMIYLGGPLNLNRVGPNSYDIMIGETLTTYVADKPMDPRNQDTFVTKQEVIPETGYLLQPNKLYLIPTEHEIGSDCYIPIMTGRSSLGRSGVSVHQEAGFGDIGFRGIWTLQVTTVFPYIIYPHMKMAQIYFITPYGDINKWYNGKYQNSKTESSTKIFNDLNI